MADNEPTALTPPATPGFVRRNLQVLQQSIRHGVDAVASGVGKVHDGMVADGRAAMQQAAGDVIPPPDSEEMRVLQAARVGRGGKRSAQEVVPNDPNQLSDIPPSSGITWSKPGVQVDPAVKAKQDAKLAIMLRKRGDIAP